MKKMKKKIKKAESDADRDKQQQRIADDVADRHSNQFPNFMALTEEEKLAFFESLHAARKNVVDTGNKITERFGTVHDEYLKYFGSVGEDNGGRESLKDSSEKLECSGTHDSVGSSLKSESSRCTYSAIPRRIVTKPVETIFIQMNMSTDSCSSPSVMSQRNSQENKSVLSKENEDGENGGFGKNPNRTKRCKRRWFGDDNSEWMRKESSSRYITKLPKLKMRESSNAQKDERKSEMSTSARSQFEILKSDEKEISFSTLKESPDKDNEILSMKDSMKKYEESKEAIPMKMKAPRTKETCLKGKANNLRVNVVITSSESERTKKEEVLKKNERSRKSEKELMEGEKEKTKNGTGARVENEKKSKVTDRKQFRPKDGLRKKQQRRDNSPARKARKPNENKKDNVKTQKGCQKACQDKRNEKGRKVLVKSERTVIMNPGGKQEKKKSLVSRRKIQKEKTEKPKKERKPKSEQDKQNRQSVLGEEEKQEEVKKDSRSSEEVTAEVLETPTEISETAKAEAACIETFLFVDKFEEDEGKEKTKETKKINNQPEHSLSSKSFSDELGEVKFLEVEGVDDKGATPSMGTTDEEVTIEVEEEISIPKTLLSVKSQERYQPEQSEPDVKQERHAEKSKSLILELRQNGEDLDDWKPRSRLVTDDEDSVLELWEELKLLKVSASDCVMETDSMTAQMEGENISESRFTFISNKIFPNKVDLAEEKLIVVGSENKIQEKGGGGREAAVLDLLKSEGVIVVDGDAIGKIKNLVEALEKEAETGRDKKLDKKTPENEYSQLLLEYINYLTRLLYVLTNKREQEPKPWVCAPLTTAFSHPQFVVNKSQRSDFIEKPRALSDTNLLEEAKTKVDVTAKESALQESEVKEDPSSQSAFSDSPMTGSSREDDLITTPSTRKKLIEDFVRERAKFVEESIDGFRIIKMTSRSCKLDSKVQGLETGQNKTKFKFFHIFSRFCKCVKKKGSEEDQVHRERVITILKHGRRSSHRVPS